MKIFKLSIFIIILFYIFSCQKDEFVTDSNALLQFSTDTLSFDTVFTGRTTITQYFCVYNPHDQNIKISDIRLSQKTKYFRMNINGVPENHQQNIKIRPKDSLYIFVEATIDPLNKQNPFMITDSIIFETNGNIQDINLIAYGQDMHLLTGGKIYEQTWTDDKPYLIRDTIFVPTNNTLTITSGAHLHFGRRSALVVQGRLVVEGTKDNPVVFCGDRLEWQYDDIPGQWRGIRLEKHSCGNVMKWAVIKNAETALSVDSVSKTELPSLDISNTRIEHHTGFGLYCKSTNVIAANTLFADCASNSVNLTNGGSYEFYHCTIANYYGYYGVRKGSALFIGDLSEKNDNVFEKAYFGNCIIYGNQLSEVELLTASEEQLNYNFENCVFKTYENSPLKQNTTNVNNCIINPQELKFKEIDFNAMKYNYELDTLSVAKNAGSIEIVNAKLNRLQFDLNGKSRTADGKPDIGAYERYE